MKPVELLEKFYQLCWESLKEPEIKLMLSIRWFPFVYGSLFGGLFTFLAISGVNLNKDTLSFDFTRVTPNMISLSVFIVLITFISPFLFLYLSLLFNKSYKNVNKLYVLKIMWRLKWTNIELTRSDQVVELCEYLNILVETSPAIETDLSLANYKLNALVSEITPTIRYHNQAFCLRDTYLTRYDFHNRSRHNYSSTKVLENIILAYENKNDFFTKYLREEKSFKSFFYEKISDDNKQDMGFLFFSLLIPRRKEMNLDIYKTILSTCRLDIESLRISPHIEITEKIRTKYSPYCFLAENTDKIEVAFSLYTDTDLKRIYTTNYNPEDFTKSLTEICSSNKKIVLPVLKRWSDIAHFIENCMQVYKEPDFIKKLENIEHPILNFKCVLTYSHLGLLANILQNCLKSRLDRLKAGYSHIIEIKKNNETYGAIELSKNKVIEIKGIRNEHLADSRQIIDLLLKHKIIDKA